MTLRIALAGAGAFGEKHLDGLRNIDGVELTSLVGRTLESTRKVAEKYGVGHVTEDLAETLERHIDHSAKAVIELGEIHV